MFGKTERKKRKIPTILGLSLGALAAIGIIRIKNKGAELFSSLKSKMKSILKRKTAEMEDFMD